METIAYSYSLPINLWSGLTLANPEERWRYARAPSEDENDPRPKTMIETAFALERLGGDWPPEDAEGFLAWFRDKVEQIPQEHRHTAKIALAGDSCEDLTDVELTITYERDETPEEIAERRAEYAKAVELYAERTRREFEELESRYNSAKAKQAR